MKAIAMTRQGGPEVTYRCMIGRGTKQQRVYRRLELSCPDKKRTMKRSRAALPSSGEPRR